ncbi:uncharacterized protein LOC124418958 [Lucilia cuprina]|uniref:uncharacterized protein LOC124418958 n=1 Tax=Lucilia cuprina TaxID=7375 RepID=UPI001F070F8F|nr:uncharacterized protein LOC124418958 [Lucilia cuprina]
MTRNFSAKGCQPQQQLHIFTNGATSSGIAAPYPIVCQNRLHHISTQLRCNTCLGWCHLRNCSGLNHHRECSETFVAPCCQQQRRNSLAASTSSSSSSYATPPPSPPQSQQPQQRQHLQQQQQPSPLTPSIAVQRPGVISILQFNCNGLQSKLPEITRFMQLNNIVVAAVQETKLTSNSSLHSCNGYNVLRKDRTRSNGGGIAFIIHNTVQYRALSLDLNARDQYLEVQGIAVRSGETDLELYNVYIPPVASCPSGYRPDIRTLLDGDMRLVLGDFNAHHQLWHSSLGEDQRGASLAEQIDESTFCTINDDAPTRIMGNCASSPDITIASSGLINYATWRAVVSLASDHLPIIICLDRPNDFIVSERRLYINQKKADWPGFREFTDRIFNDLPAPSNVHQAESKILGVTFDSLFTSSAHATAITHKLRSRNKVLKALAAAPGEWTKKPCWLPIKLLAGQWSIMLLQCGLHFNEEFLNNMSDLCLFQINGVLNNSNKLLDLVFVNEPKDCSLIRHHPITKPEDRHHPTIEVNCNYPISVKDNKNRNDIKEYCFKKTNYNDLNFYLSNTNWLEILSLSRYKKPAANFPVSRIFNYL